MTAFDQIAQYFQQGTLPTQQTPSLMDLLVAVSKSLDLVKGRPYRHTLRLALTAGRLGVALKLPQRALTNVIHAALLHDIGLPVIAHELFQQLPSVLSEKTLFYAHTLLGAGIANLPDGLILSPEAQTILYRHPEAAQASLGAFPVASEVADIVATHHELCDGSGYPKGLKKREIPIESRLLALADVVTCLLDELHGVENRRQGLLTFLTAKENHPKFDKDVTHALHVAIKESWEGEVFLKALFATDIEAQLKDLMPDHRRAMTAWEVLCSCQTLGQLSDILMPGYSAPLKGNAFNPLSRMELMAGFHSHNVGRLACRMAMHLGIPKEQCGELALAGLLHDVGMLSLPLGILLKKEPLKREDWAVIHHHPQETENILKGIHGFDTLTHWASEHHEQLNAKGYHCGKKGVDISVGGRLLALADVFDALTAKRPYRSIAYDPMDALPIIQQGRGHQFDPNLIPILRHVVLNEEFVLSDESSTPVP